MELYYGVVEDRDDPLKIGRVRVRVQQHHTHLKDLISTVDLPWSQVIMPTTTPGLGGLGSSHSLVEGTTVIGTFTDKDKLKFIVLGVNQGVSQQGFLENQKGEITKNSPDFGFCDPRRNSADDYSETTDGSGPKHAPERAITYKRGLDWYPHLLNSLEFDYTGSQKTKKEEPKDSEKTLPYYPLITDASDINVFDATSYGETAAWTGAPLHRDLSKIEMGEFAGDKKFPDAMMTNPQYPFNNTTYTESGHLFELDDTRDYERVSLQHRMGTFFEWQSDGDAVQRVAKDNYTAICGNDYMYVSGDVNIMVLGNARIHANKDISIKGYGDGKIQVAGKLELKAGSRDISLESSTAVAVKAPVFKPNA